MVVIKEDWHNPQGEELGMNWGEREVLRTVLIFFKSPKILNASRSIDAAVSFSSTAVDVNKSLGRGQDAC